MRCTLRFDALKSCTCTCCGVRSVCANDGCRKFFTAAEARRGHRDMVGKRIKRAYFFERAYFCSVETEMSPPKRRGREKAGDPACEHHGERQRHMQATTPTLIIGHANTASYCRNFSRTDEPGISLLMSTKITVFFCERGPFALPLPRSHPHHF